MSFNLIIFYELKEILGIQLNFGTLVVHWDIVDHF